MALADLDTLLWREASLAADVDSFLARVGTNVLSSLDATGLMVRVLDREHHYLDTVATIRHGAVGVTRPMRPRAELTAAAAARVAAWIEAGESEHPGPGAASTVARDLLRGIADPSDGEWWLVPLAAGSDVLGVVLVGAANSFDTRRFAVISEPIAAVLATEQSRRELLQLREAAEADKDAALARLQMRDIGAAGSGPFASVTHEACSLVVPSALVTATSAIASREGTASRSW